MSAEKHIRGDNPWILDGGRARLKVGPLRGVVDIESPHHGIANLAIHGRDVAGKILGVQLGGERSDESPAADSVRYQPDDLFVRGADLVVSYRQPLGRPFNLQIYWRATIAPLCDAAIDVIISLNTREWEAYPGLHVESNLTAQATETIVADAGSGFLWRAADFSYGETTRPGDFNIVAENAHPAAAQGSRWQFTPEFMERGVIRRLQIRGALLGAQCGAGALGQIQATLVNDPLPLTA